MRDIRTKEDADSIREHVEAVFEGWYADASRIDWEDFLYRVENRDDHDLGTDMGSPAIKRIQAIVRELRNS